MKTNWFKRTLCSILAFVMVLGYVPVPTFAAETDGLCAHHTQHTEVCGYSPAVEGHECGHAHTEECYQSVTECVHSHGDCGYVAAVEGVDCDHQHDGACGYAEAVAEVPCTCQQEEHTEDCAYAPAIPEVKCSHIHGECSYVEAKGEIPCDHDCANDEACGEKILACAHKHDENCGYVEAVEGKVCEFVCEDCAAEEASAAAVAEVKNLMDALPKLDAVQAVSMEDQKAAYEQTQATYEAYGKLTAEQQAQLPDPEEVFKPLFEYFNTLISADSGENSFGFTFQLNSDNQTLTITGLSGTLEEGQNLAIPGTIEGKTVTGITGTFGNDPYGFDESNTTYGTITLPDTITTIKDFSCHGFTGTFTIPSSVTTISGTNGGENITSLIVNASVTNIPEGGLRNFRGVKTVTFAEGIKSVSGYNFCDAYHLERVNVPDSMTYLGSTNLFRDTAPIVFYLKRFEVSYPFFPDAGTTMNRAEAIGIYGFPYYYTNEGETFPVETVTIKQTGFQRESNYNYNYTTEYPAEGLKLEAVTYPVNATIINSVNWTIENENLLQINDDGTVVLKGTGTTKVQCEVDGVKGPQLTIKVTGTDDLYTYTDNEDGSITLTGLKGTLEEGQNLAIPGTIEGKTVTGITGTFGNDPYGFDENEATYGTITLPDSITTIKDFSCHGFTGTFTIPSSVTTLSGSIGGDRIENLIINANVSHLSEGTFQQFRGIKKLTFGENIKSVGAHMFSYATKLEQVNVPDSMTSLVNTYTFNENAPIVFYLKRFEVSYPYFPDAGTTMNRAEAIGIYGFPYYYTNEGETFPVETVTIKQTGFQRESNYNYNYTTEYPAEGLKLEAVTYPVNATIINSVNWTIENENLLQINDDGTVVLKGTGTTKVQCEVDGVKGPQLTIKVTGTDDLYTYTDNEDGSITLTGLKGTLEEGQNLAIPSTIEGKAVTGITGTFGNAPYGFDASNTTYGTITLPDTITTIKDFSCHGFTGTLIIPSSVTTISGECGGDQIEKLIVNANMSHIPETSFRGFRGIKELTFGGNVKSVGGHNFPYATKLEKVYVSDTITSLESAWFSDKSPVVFYLKRFEVNDKWDPDGGTTMNRASAIGISNFPYYYTNEGEEFPVEGVLLKKQNFLSFREQVGQYYSETTGLYRDWSGSLDITILPINATQQNDTVVTSDTPGIVSIDGTKIIADEVGTTKIMVTVDSVTRSFAMEVRGIHIISTSNGVTSDNLPGNMEIPEDAINTVYGLILELEADKLNPKDWTHWGQLKKILEEAYDKALECADVFEIHVSLKNGTSVWKIQPIDGKKISIWMPIEDATDLSKHHLVHVKDDGTYEEIDFTYEPIDGVSGIRFETMSFSSFALVEELGELHVQNRIEVDASELGAQTSAWIDGVQYSVEKNGDICCIQLPVGAEATNMITYSYHVGDSADIHTQYPVSMKVWILKKQDDGNYTATRVEELDDILQYAGSSIRITGNKGIRMITSVNQDTRNKLTGNGLAGFKLLEYGTLLAQTSKLGDNPLVLVGGEYVKSNYAYKKGVADPVFKYTNGLIQYTNVLIGFTDEQCKEDIAMRPYMKLLDENGEEVVIYGGIVYRSIGYIAYQNRNAFQPGSAAYEYVWSIIHNVYDNQYDDEYKK